MKMCGEPVKVFVGNASKNLGEAICRELGVNPLVADIKSFSDGEISLSVYESVRGADVFLIQATSTPNVNDHIMELLIMIDSMKRASAARITAVIPYYGYARQDRKAKARDPISAKLVANLLTVAGADRILCMDLHAAQIQGYFDIPFDHLLGQSIMADYISSKEIDDLCVVAPDFGSVRRARDFSKRLGASIAIIEKRRPEANKAEVVGIIGDVKGKNVVLIDDIIDTAGTLCGAAVAIKEAGAKSVRACATHAIFSGPAVDRLTDSAIDEVVVLDTIELPEEKHFDKLTVLSSASMFAEANRRIYGNSSISDLFRPKE